MEICNKCKIVLYSRNGKIRFVDDDTSEKTTRAFQEIRQYCRNENCENYCGKVVTDKSRVVDTVLVELT